jgi:hypothetical protein
VLRIRNTKKFRFPIPKLETAKLNPNSQNPKNCATKNLNPYAIGSILLDFMTIQFATSISCN